MELYLDPVATTSRAVLAFCRHAEIAVTLRPLSLMKGEHLQPPLAQLNPNCLVPVLVDDAFVLTEASAILRYLARRQHSPLYPAGLREAARVDEMMGWFDTQLYRDFGCQYVYPQVIPLHRRATDEATQANVAWGRERARRWLAVLDTHWLAHGKAWLLGDELTIADFFGASILSLGELIGCRFDGYPNVRRWRASMGSLASWREANEQFRAFTRSLEGRPSVPLEDAASEPARAAG